jgi:hypothetical protein
MPPTSSDSSEGSAPSWNVEKKEARISMRVEPSLKEAFETQLPKYASISDILRDFMIRVAREEEQP